MFRVATVVRGDMDPSPGVGREWKGRGETPKVARNKPGASWEFARSNGAGRGCYGLAAGRRALSAGTGVEELTAKNTEIT